MYRRVLVFSCKLLILLLRFVGRNGSAFPGLVIERLAPRFLEKSLSPVEKKIILVTGTNGKTTTTKMLATALRASGDRVVTNSSGSNMTRGLISALVEDMTILGSLRETDWFVFEMDEAYTPRFTAKISPRVLVGLNVMRDQLDRYGEVNTTASLIGAAAKKSDIFIYNQLDPLLRGIADNLADDSRLSFGVTKQLADHVVNEQTTQGIAVRVPSESADVVLESVHNLRLGGQRASVSHGKAISKFTIPLEGFHNALNATAVVATLLVVVDRVSYQSMEALSNMPVPFGRGERLNIGGKSLTVALAKNPSGFMSNLETFLGESQPEAILFVINDKIADGRDVSWLWDIDIKRYIKSDKGLRLYSAGIRGYDMALRLKHDGLSCEMLGSSAEAVQKVIGSKKHADILIIPTYTALFEIHQELAKHGEVPRIW